MLLLPCWQKNPPIVGDDWLKYTYTLAVAKLDSAFPGRTCATLSFDRMDKKQKDRALICISTMKEIIAPFILHPTRAVQRFHLGSQLLEDWDTFNLKKEFLRAASPVRLRGGEKRGQTASESSSTSTKSPKKLKPSAKDPIQAPLYSEQELISVRKELEITQSHLLEARKNALDDKRAICSTNMTVNQLNAGKIDLENQVAEREARVLFLSREIKVRAECVLLV